MLQQWTFELKEGEKKREGRNVLWWFIYIYSKDFRCNESHLENAF